MKCPHRLISKRYLRCAKCKMSRYDQLMEKDKLTESEIEELHIIQIKGVLE